MTGDQPDTGHRLLGNVCSCGDWWAQCGNDIPEQWRQHVNATESRDAMTAGDQPDTGAAAAAARCERCTYESKGMGSSDRCICGPNVPCGWCGQGLPQDAAARSEDEDTPDDAALLAAEGAVPGGSTRNPAEWPERQPTYPHRPASTQPDTGAVDALWRACETNASTVTVRTDDLRALLAQPADAEAVGLRARLAAAWDEGWRAAVTPGRGDNPYRVLADTEDPNEDPHKEGVGQ